MIKYFFKNGDSFNLSLNNFVSLTCLGLKHYKSDFSDLSKLVKYIDNNINIITELILDNNQMTLKDGLIHNLYKQSLHRYIDSGYTKGMYSYYYYHGHRLFTDNGTNIKNENELISDDIYYYKNYHIDQIRDRKNKIPVDILKLRELEQRKHKIQNLLI